MLYSVVATYLVSQLSAEYAMRQGEKGKLTSNQIQDLLHDLFPSTGYEWVVANILLAGLLGLLLYTSPRPLLRVFLEMSMILILFRSVTTAVTVIPQVEQCNFKLGLPTHTCHDMMFSGHTAMGTLAYLFIWKYKLVTSTTLTMTTIALFSLYYSLIASRSHYTVDVLIGILVAISIFYLYPKPEVY